MDSYHPEYMESNLEKETKKPSQNI